MIIGVEAANSFVKLKAPGDNEDYYLNTRKELIAEEEGHLLGEDKEKQTVFEIDGSRFIVGDPKGVSSTDRSEERYKDKKYKHETLAAVATQISDGQKVSIVTGLPADHYKKKYLHDDVINNLKGNHTVFVDGERKKFNIDRVHVMLQPLGSLMYYIFNFDGTVRKGREHLLKAKILVIDIGFGTTDVVEVDSMQPSESEGIDVGMINATKFFSTIIKNEFPRINGLPDGLQLDQTMRYKDMIMAGGVEYDIKEMKNKAYSLTADEILSKVGVKGFNLNQYDLVLFTGGGVEALRDQLKIKLEGTNARRLEKSQMANAYGYYTYGVIKL
ncbi:ParM/StbA family protein (plasmid) [Bacillus carboniphilus]|uniref:ParM/StbA family protein n=1 Tax=Bacillus carboniphilus TaxID=86663 RepID=A0ABY9JYH4_9BACI|nr:ParM/StbA family protein [Bacillus carboniphilus]WLR44437.1 ParM/StbA family protein [Bacillus carboniphilus]